MLTLLCTFTAILLGILYLFFQAFPFVFIKYHGFDLQTTGLTFLGMLIGMIIGTLTDPLWTRLRSYLIQTRLHPIAPELRLPPGILGGILVPLGIFWFAWTAADPSIHPIVPIIGSGFFATGTLLVFSSVFTFLVEAHPLYAASALAANSFTRACFAAGFPLFSAALYTNLGVGWAGSLLGFLTVAISPCMVAFFFYGARLRRWSRFAGEIAGEK
jgi:hypothetical protein